MGREAQRLHLPVKTQCFVHLGTSCELGNRKKWDGRQTGGIYLWKANVLRMLEEDQQHAHWCFHNRVWRPKDVKTSENETVPQLIPKCTKHCVFTGKCNLCASRPIFFYSLIRNLFQTAKNIVFSQVNAACVSRPIFSYSLIQNLFQHAQNIVFSQVDVHVSLVPFFLIP